jgi:hypothetical protein
MFVANAGVPDANTLHDSNAARAADFMISMV